MSLDFILVSLSFKLVANRQERCERFLNRFYRADSRVRREMFTKLFPMSSSCIIIKKIYAFSTMYNCIYDFFINICIENYILQITSK